MGPNAKAGLGLGLAQGLQTMGMALLDAQDRTERRAFQQYQVQEAARDRKERAEDRQFRRWFQKEEFRRAGEASERAEQTKREDRYLNAQRDAAELRTRGFDAFLEPPAISLAGDPTKPGGLTQSTTIPSVPRMVVGSYNPERDPDYQRTVARGNYFTSKGYGVEGQLPPRQSAPEMPRGILVTETDPNTGEERQVLVDPTTGDPIKTFGARPRSGGNDAFQNLIENTLGESADSAGVARRFFREIPMDTAIQALNSAQREGKITKEEHADALARYRRREVTAEDIEGWLSSPYADPGR